MKEQSELRDLGFKLAGSSDYLTDEARKFVVTTDVQHLNRYWQEVEVTKTRDQVVARLKEMGAPQAEFDLIEQAKADSDGLVRTETRAMRLVLSDQDRASSAPERAGRAFRGGGLRQDSRGPGRPDSGPRRGSELGARGACEPLLAPEVASWHEGLEPLC